MEKSVVLSLAGGGTSANYALGVADAALNDPELLSRVQAVRGYSGGGIAAAMVGYKHGSNTDAVERYVRLGLRRHEFIVPGNIGSLIKERLLTLFGASLPSKPPPHVFDIDRLMEIMQEDIGFPDYAAPFDVLVDVAQRGPQHDVRESVQLNGKAGPEVRQALHETASVYPYYHPPHGTSRVDTAWTLEGTSYPALQERYPDSLIVHIENAPIPQTSIQRTRRQLTHMFHGFLAGARYNRGVSDVLRTKRRTTHALHQMQREGHIVIAPDTSGSTIETDPSDAGVVYQRGWDDYERKLKPALEQKRNRGTSRSHG